VQGGAELDPGSGNCNALLLLGFFFFVKSLIFSQNFSSLSLDRTLEVAINESHKSSHFQCDTIMTLGFSFPLSSFDFNCLHLLNILTFPFHFC
jgi:hypothetical protein